MKLMVFAVLLVTLAGCGGPPRPLVDMRGKDPAQTNDDMAWCQNNRPAFAFGNSISKCMKEKGYTLLSDF
jgi:hypothetical protein